MFGVGINPAVPTPESFPFGEKMLLLYPKSAQPTSSIRMKMIFGPEENKPKGYVYERKSRCKVT